MTVCQNKVALSIVYVKCSSIRGGGKIFLNKFEGLLTP